MLIVASCATVVYLTNYTFIYLFLKRDYSYSNFNGTFRFKEYGMKGLSYSSAKISYNSFLEKHPDIKDKQLYRTFWITPWRFWEWNQYLNYSERFKLPYISESEISKNQKE
ncbi:hypothetical protein B0I21_103247 [Sphingobacterium paludis]|uniref:Uncharacterized protein n=1 Tax=Sphingobacterium paludis TaxID=1476465 RepID=A0A4V3E245_9SPHI|nr:hypothetical protein B0I21_103247 [Sphingobacterium paludis]